MFWDILKVLNMNASTEEICTHHVLSLELEAESFYCVAFFWKINPTQSLKTHEVLRLPRRYFQNLQRFF